MLNLITECSPKQVEDMNSLVELLPTRLERREILLYLQLVLHAFFPKDEDRLQAIHLLTTRQAIATILPKEPR